MTSKQIVLKARREGISVRQIAKEYDIPIGTVLKYLYPQSRFNRHLKINTKYSESTYHKVFKTRLLGYTTLELSKKFGIPVSTVQAWFYADDRKALRKRLGYNRTLTMSNILNYVLEGKL